MTRIIDPVDCAGLRGAMRQAVEEHRSMFEARRRGNMFGAHVREALRKAAEDEREQATRERCPVKSTGISLNGLPDGRARC